jgi:hypothetical protein
VLPVNLVNNIAAFLLSNPGKIPILRTSVKTISFLVNVSLLISTSQLYLDGSPTPWEKNLRKLSTLAVPSLLTMPLPWFSSNIKFPFNHLQLFNPNTDLNSLPGSMAYASSPTELIMFHSTRPKKLTTRPVNFLLFRPLGF